MGGEVTYAPPRTFTFPWGLSDSIENVQGRVKMTSPPRASGALHGAGGHAHDLEVRELGAGQEHQPLLRAWGDNPRSAKGAAVGSSQRSSCECEGKWVESLWNHQRTGAGRSPWAPPELAALRRALRAFVELVAFGVLPLVPRAARVGGGVRGEPVRKRGPLSQGDVQKG